MATYKVIQDIEAEDKLIGWLTPRQAIYAAIVIVSGLIVFMLATNGAWWLGIPFLPHMILFTILAGPFVHDQPSEVWLIAKIKFALKPRRRIWDQSGLKELVTITVPKKIERHLTDGLSQVEVKSRLQALANTIDSRGWAIKNIDANLYAQPGYATASNDRIIGTDIYPQEVPDFDTYAADDILNETSNPTAMHMQQMINQSTQAHRQQILAQMQQPQAAQTQPANYWFVDPATVPTPPPAPVAPSQPVLSEQELLDKIHKDQARAKHQTNLQHLRTIDPTTGAVIQETPPAQSRPANQVDAAEEARKAILTAQLAQNNDLNISTIARQVNKPNQVSDLGDNEVVISLH